jgi:hypothetical protein
MNFLSKTGFWWYYIVNGLIFSKSARIIVTVVVMVEVASPKPENPSLFNSTIKGLKVD